jgi:GntR family transcriptional repressor for pyruvate dehydrogenase complex
MSNTAPQLALSQVPRQKLREAVAEQLLDAIKGLPPGTRVPSERKLTAQLGVGRSTVREALNGLALLGVVEIRHGQGVFVAERPVVDDDSGSLAAALDRAVTKDFIEARLVVEVQAARLAAERRDDDDLRRLSDAIAEQKQRLSKPDSGLLDVAASFNVLLAEAAHNEILVAIVQSFVGLMMERAPKIYSLDGFAEWDLAEHQGLYEAVRDGDVELAAERMRTHILELADRYQLVGAG